MTRKKTVARPVIADREKAKAALGVALQAMLDLWDAERELEKALGGDVKDMNGIMDEMADICGGVPVTEEIFKHFLNTVDKRKGWEPRDEVSEALNEAGLIERVDGHVCGVDCPHDPKEVK